MSLKPSSAYYCYVMLNCFKVQSLTVRTRVVGLSGGTLYSSCGVISADLYSVTMAGRQATDSSRGTVSVNVNALLVINRSTDDLTTRYVVEVSERPVNEQSGRV